MDDNDKDKSLIEKTIEAVRDIATIASDAAKKAMEPEPLKPGEKVMMMPLMDSVSDRTNDAAVRRTSPPEIACENGIDDQQSDQETCSEEIFQEKESCQGAEARGQGGCKEEDRKEDRQEEEVEALVIG
jgi:hypothetical protein